jgi:NCS1 family nucleobase:cation symporter-1
MEASLRKRGNAIKEGVKKKMKPSGWIVPREPSALADEGTW